MEVVGGRCGGRLREGEAVGEGSGRREAAAAGGESGSLPA